MPQPDTLFELVHVLTPDEKRFFKKEARRHFDRPDYLALFDAVNHQDHPNDEELREAIGLPSGDKSLSPRKSQLRQMILNSMSVLRRKHNATARVREWIAQAEFLRDKMLFGQSMRTILKAKSLAKEFQLHASLVEVLNLEIWVFNKMKTPATTDHFEELIDEMKGALRNLSLEKEYKIMGDRLIAMTLREMNVHGKEEMDKIDLMMADFNPIPPSTEKPFMISHFYYVLQSFYAQLKGDHEGLYQHYRSTYELWSEHATQVDEHQYLFPRVLLNYLHSCTVTGRMEEFPKVMQRLEDFFDPRDPLFEKRYKKVLHYQLLYQMNQGQFDAMASTVERMNTLVDRFRHEMGSNELISITYNLCIYYFICEDQDRALEKIREILGISKRSARVDVQRGVRLIELTLRYDLNDQELLASLFRSSGRFMRNHASDLGFEPTFLKYLKKASRFPDFEKEKRRMVLKEALEELKGIVPEEGPAPIGFRELMIWLEARATNRPMLEILGASSQVG